MALMLLYLTSFNQRVGGTDSWRAWKSYDWNAIDTLQGEGLIDTSRRAKSACLTEAGIERAKKLLGRYRMALDDDAADERA